MRRLISHVIVPLAALTLAALAFGCAAAEPEPDPLEKQAREGANLVCAGALDCPIAAPFTVTNGFGIRSGRGVHLAVDISADEGDVVTAACQGPIVYSSGAVGGYGAADGSPGPVVLQRCDDVVQALVVLYGHCRGDAPVGTVLARGQRVCRVSNYVGPGGADWDHLHFGARLGTFGEPGNFFQGYASGQEDLQANGGQWVDPLSWHAEARGAGCAAAERCHNGLCPSDAPLPEGARFLIAGGDNAVYVNAGGHRHPILNQACRDLIDGPDDVRTACVTRAVAERLVEAPLVCADGAFVRVPGEATVYRLEDDQTHALCGPWSQAAFRAQTGFDFGAALPVPQAFLDRYPPATPGIYPAGQQGPACGRPGYECGMHRDPTGQCFADLDCGACACRPTDERAEVRCEGDNLVWFDDCGELRGQLPCRHGCADGACRACGGERPRDHTACLGAELWYFDECDEPTLRAEPCAHGCVDGACREPACDEGVWRAAGEQGCQLCVGGSWAAPVALMDQACRAQGCHPERGPRWADLPDGTACPGGTCQGGSCRAAQPQPVCAPGAYEQRADRCDRCTGDGLAWQLGERLEVRECEHSECEPDAGLRWRADDGQACGDAGRCEAGACVEPQPAVCEPNRYALRDGQCQRCRADGSAWLAGAAPVDGGCRVQRCDAALGLVWEDRDGRACGDAGQCEAGACVEPAAVCQSGQYALRAGQCQLCSPSGDRWLAGAAPQVGECRTQICNADSGLIWQSRDGAPCGDGGTCDDGICVEAPQPCEHGACAMRFRPGDNGILEVLARAYTTVDGQPMTELVAQGRMCAIAWARDEPWNHTEVPVADHDGDGWVSFRLPQIRPGWAPYAGCWRCNSGLPLRFGFRRCAADLLVADHYMSAGWQADERAGAFFYRGTEDNCAEGIGFAVSFVDGRYVPAGEARSIVCQ